MGEGLVNQIPALLISTATGIIVTRAARSDLGTDLLPSSRGSRGRCGSRAPRSASLAISRAAQAPVPPRRLVALLARREPGPGERVARAAEERRPDRWR
ncbi:MAG: hypothetical protein KatS3mg010_1471 [Acidimicrobiia bacterium]|nr:MAG: hypothetical protein KatS3mg010_1471 [Acidimicrobiia bacterium]